jgi:hypothetical protein
MTSTHTHTHTPKIERVKGREKSVWSLQHELRWLTGLIDKVLSCNTEHSAHALKLALRYLNYMFEL